jgi:hypothetical protein
MNISDYNILSTILTAAAAGGGTSLLLNTISELRDLQRKRNLEKRITKRVTGTTADTTDEDLKNLLIKDALEDDNVKHAAEEDRHGDAYTVMANVLGSILALGASYYGANKLYNSVKKKLLQDEGADITKDYYDQLFLLKKLQDQNIVTGRTRKYGSFAGALGGLGGILLLGGLASAIMTRQILKDKYPLLNTSNAYDEALKIVPQPALEFADDRKLREQNELDKKELLRNLVEETSEDNEGASLKLASTVKDLLADEVNENILKLAYYSENECADNLGIQNIVHSVANGHRHLLKQANTIEELFDIADKCALTKFASAEPLKIQLAFTAIAKDPMLKETIIPAAGIQVLHAYPLQNKLASLISEEVDNDFARSDMSVICAVNNLLSRAHAFAPFRKEAAEKLKQEDKLDKIFDYPFDNGLTTFTQICRFLDN